MSNTRKIKRPKGRKAAIEEAARRALTLPKGSTVAAYLYHQHDCAMYQGEECTCRPDIQLVPVAGPRTN